MSVIGSMIANLKAKTAVFDKKMGGSRKHVRGMRTDFSGLRSTLIKATAAFAGFLGVRAIVRMTRDTMTAVDAVGKLSDRIGIATENIITFRHAAVLTGAGVAVLDKSLETMVRRLGEADKLGIGEAIDGLELLGITIKDIQKLTPGEAFIEIAERIQGIADTTEKAVIAYKLFGRQGVTLLNTLNLGREGMEAMRAEVDRLGVSMDRVSIAKVEAANDSIFRLQQLITGMRQRFAVAVAPIVVAVTNKLIDMGVEGGFATSSIFLGLEKISLALTIFGTAIDSVKIAWIGLKIVVTNVLLVIVDGIAKGIELFIDFSNLVDKIRYFGLKPDIPYPTEIRAFQKALEEGVIEDMTNLIKLTDSFGASGDKVRAFFDDIQNRAQLAAEEMAAFNRQYIDGLNLLDQLDATGKSTVKGTFNARLVGLLGFGNPMQEISFTNKEIAKNTGILVRKARSGGLVYT